MFQKLESIVGEKAFVKLILIPDNALEQAIRESKVSVVEYFASFDGVKKVYASNNKWMKNLIKVLFVFNQNPKVVDTVMKSLELTPNKVSDFLLMDDSEF